MPVPEERAATARRRKLLNLRRAWGASGLSYGVGAYGFPLGSILGVQATDPPVNPDQFAGIDTSTGGGTDSSADSGADGATGDSGGTT